MIIYGLDVADLIHPILVDAVGRTIVSASELTTTGGKIKVDSSGRIIIDGESPSLLRPIDKKTSVSNLNLPAGTSVQTIATVPAGETWRATMVGHRYTGTVAGVGLGTRIDVSGTFYPLLATVPPVSGVAVFQLLNVILVAGDIVSTNVTGATLNDDYLGVLFAERIY